MKKELSEGLHRFDLRGLLDNVLSIDEYNSKIEDDAIVVAFYLLDEPPAVDLDQFIQSLGIDVLDSEASEQPEKNNKWPVFVEFYRDKNFVNNLLKLLSLIENLTGPMNWRFKPYGKKLSYSLNEDNLIKMIRLNHSVTEEIENFINNNSSKFVELENRKIIIEDKKFNILAFGNKEKIYNIFDLNYKKPIINESSFFINSKLQKIFPLFEIENIDQYTLMHYPLTNKVLVLQLVD